MYNRMEAGSLRDVNFIKVKILKSYFVSLSVVSEIATVTIRFSTLLSRKLGTVCLIRY